MSDAQPARNLLAVAWGEVLTLVEPVLASADPWRRARLMRALGWDLEAISGVDARTFEEWVGTIRPALAALGQALAEAKWSSLKEIAASATAAGSALGRVGALPPALDSGTLPDVPGLPEALADDLIDHLVLTYLQRRVPWAVPLLVLLGLVTPTAEASPSPPMPAGDAPIRLPRRRAALHLDRLVDVVADPGGYLRGLYAPDGLDTPEQVDAMSARLLPRLAAVLQAYGVDAAHGVRPGIGPDLGEAGLRLADHLLRVRFGRPDGSAAAGPAAAADLPYRLGLTLGLTSWDGRLTAIVAPTGETQLSGSFGEWNVTTDLTGAGSAVAVNSAGVTVTDGGPEVRFDAEIARIGPADGAGWLIGAPDGTHLAIGQLTLRGRGALGTGRDDIDLTVHAGRAELVVRSGDGDGLLARLLPAGGLRIGFDLGLGWSSRTGLHLAGAAALSADYPLHLPLPGGGLEGLRLALTADTSTRTVSLTAATTVNLALGPLRAVVANTGVRLDLTFPAPAPAGTPDPTAGNLGGANLVPRFKAPDGVGLSVTNGVVNGGGYLFVDETRGRYAGVMALSMSTKDGAFAPARGIALQATAILDTRQPDGSRFTDTDGDSSFSLLMIGTFQWFPGLPLFWGISLTGLGLVVGHHRRSNPEEIGNAARAGTLDSLLFPTDVVGRAPSIVAALSRIFPADPTGTVVGAMVRLEMLSRQIVADLAVVVEFPDPVRISVLGRVTIDFKAAGRLRLDAAGVLDLDRRQFTLNAALVDSRLFGRPASGQMLLYASWGAKKTFVATIGGYHPRYVPPANLPVPERFTIQLLKNTKGITLKAYLAVTSNSAQVGGEVLMKFEGGGFLLDGRATLDALVQFKPFWFEVAITAKVALSYKGTDLLVIDLAIALNGPGEWHAWGHARIKFLCWEASASFDWRHGNQPVDRDPSFVDVAALLGDALTGAAAWETGPGLPGAEPVTLRNVTDTGEVLLLSPGATLAVRQNVVPLDVELGRFGTSRITGPNRFTISEVRVGAGDGAVRGTLGAAVLDDFAPGQFQDLTPEQQWMMPGFERQTAGRHVALPEGTALPAAPLTVHVGLDGDDAYDRVIIDDPDSAGREMPATVVASAGSTGDLLATAAGSLRTPTRVTATGSLLARFASTGPAARARTAGAARFDGSGLGLVDHGPAWLPVRNRPGGRRPATTGTVAGRSAATDPAGIPVPTATRAAELASGGDRARPVRRVTVPVGTPT
ncbi:DUF6603 domain-containing protein, partial [Micromonospora echinofusca]